MVLKDELRQLLERYSEEKEVPDVDAIRDALTDLEHLYSEFTTKAWGLLLEQAEEEYKREGGK